MTLGGCQFAEQAKSMANATGETRSRALAGGEATGLLVALIGCWVKLETAAMVRRG
jgi:hypothetical protein